MSVAAKKTGPPGPMDQTTLLELYKLHVQMADKVSDRRLKANAFYVSLSVGMLVLTSRFGWLELETRAHALGLFLIALLGLLVCGVWRTSVLSFQRLNRAKFQVINELEKQLPFAGFELEWQLLVKGESRRRYVELTRLERVLPLVVAVPFVVFLSMAVLSLPAGA